MKRWGPSEMWDCAARSGGQFGSKLSPHVLQAPVPATRTPCYPPAPPACAPTCPAMYFQKCWMPGTSSVHHRKSVAMR